MKKYVLVNPSSGNGEILDSEIMTAEEAKKQNDILRSHGLDDRWILDRSNEIDW